jgi:hypothetical protein
MWQRRKLSTNEELSKAGPLPENWGPIFGLEGIKDRIGDLSWVGPHYADMGWIELSEAEQEAIRLSQVLARVEEEKEIANAALSSSELTVEGKASWLKFLLDLDLISLQADAAVSPWFPARPVDA